MYILDFYIRPLQERVFIGYFHNPPRSLMNFIVRWPGLSLITSVVDPESLSLSQRSGSGSFYHQAKIVRKTLIPYDIRHNLYFR
jgi:hypothetical protein